MISHLAWAAAHHFSPTFLDSFKRTSTNEHINQHKTPTRIDTWAKTNLSATWHPRDLTLR